MCRFWNISNDASKIAHSALSNKIINKTSSFIFIFFFLWVLRPVKIISLIWSRVIRKVGRNREIPEIINDKLFAPGQLLKSSLTFKCLIEHMFVDVSYSRPLDNYLWKQTMKMNRNIKYKWCNIDKKHLLFTKRKCHKFPWLFTASCCSPRRRSICACRIACKVLIYIGLY